MVGWSVKSVAPHASGGEKWEDTFNCDMKEMNHLNSEKYLGQILGSDSKTFKNITKLRNKGIGIKDKIFNRLSKIPDGGYPLKYL